MLMPTTATATDNSPELWRLPGHRPEDLELNRSGRLAPVQARQLRAAMRGKVIGTVIYGVSLFFIILSNGFDFVRGLLCLALVAGVYAIASQFMAIRHGSVVSAEGDAWTEKVIGDEGPDTYFIHIRGTRLEISRDAYWVIRPGGPYRAYYIASPRQFVALEAMPGWRADPAGPVASAKKGWRLPIRIEL